MESWKDSQALNRIQHAEHGRHEETIPLDVVMTAHIRGQGMDQTDRAPQQLFLTDPTATVDFTHAPE